MNTLSVQVTVNLTFPTDNLISKIVFLHYDFTNSGVSIFNFNIAKCIRQCCVTVYQRFNFDSYVK